MTSVNISITEEAYRRLEKMKDDDKSFTDIILELTKNSPFDFSSMVGAGIGVKWEEVKASREKSSEDKKREILLFGH